MINLNLPDSTNRLLDLFFYYAISIQKRALILSFCFLGFSFTNVIYAQSVSTDKPDYSPKETAYIIAKGFQKGEEAVFQVMHIDGKTNNGNGHEPWSVVDGSKYDLDGKVDGNIKTSWYVDPDDSFNSVFELCAQGKSSGLQATWKFLDDTPVPTGVAATYNPNTDDLTVIVDWLWTEQDKKVGTIAVFADLNQDGIKPDQNDNPADWTSTYNAGFAGASGGHIPSDEFLGQISGGNVEGTVGSDKTTNGIAENGPYKSGQTPVPGSTPHVLFYNGLNPINASTGSFSVTYSGVKIQPKSICVILYDVHIESETNKAIKEGVGKKHNPISAGTGYNTDNSVDDGFDPGDGNITVSCTDPAGSFVFPVELANFSVTENNAITTINWTTANELDSDFFEVQRSKDGYNFEKIGNVPAQGTSQNLNKYTFKDMRPNMGQNYYRLKMVDTDGAFEYSSIEVITISPQNADANHIKYFPNPTTGELTIDFQGYGNGQMNVEIINAVGTIVERLQVESNNKIRMSQFPQGVYYLRAIDVNNNLINTQKIVKIY